VSHLGGGGKAEGGQGGLAQQVKTLSQILLRQYAGFLHGFAAHGGTAMAGGQAKLKGKVVRIAHLGYQSPLDVITALSTLEMALVELGYQVPLGAGVAAAQKYFLEEEV